MYSDSGDILVQDGSKWFDINSTNKEIFSLFALLSTLFSNLLYAILKPLRLVLRHRDIIISIVAAIYCFMAFTAAGKALTYECFGINLIGSQNSTYTSTAKLQNYSTSQSHRLILVSSNQTGTESNLYSIK